MDGGPQIRGDRGDERVKPEEIMTTREVADTLGCTPAYVRRLAQLGKLRPLRRGSGRFDAHQVATFEKARRQDS